MSPERVVGKPYQYNSDTLGDPAVNSVKISLTQVVHDLKQPFLGGLVHIPSGND